MRAIKLLLAIIGVVELVLEAGFFFRLAMGDRAGPLPDTPLEAGAWPTAGLPGLRPGAVRPLFARYGSVQPEHLHGQLAASAIIIFSAALGVYYHTQYRKGIV